MLFSRLITRLILLITVLFSIQSFAEDKINIPVLCYHNLSAKPGSMNMTPQRFESQLKWIKDNGFTVIPLAEAVEYLQGKRDSIPAKSIVITADDGWASAYTSLVPLMKKYNFPVTLFIYPETISHGKNAMTWEQLKELQKSNLVDIQGHTYSHPNFKHEKKRLSPANYEKFVTRELAGSKQILEDKLGKKIIFLAWPFGIYDKYLEEQAEKAGYTMSFTIDARTANKSYRPQAQPRFMIIDAQSQNTFAGIVKRATSNTHLTGDKHIRQQASS